MDLIPKNKIGSFSIGSTMWTVVLANTPVFAVYEDQWGGARVVIDSDDDTGDAKALIA